jgi:zinc transport system substrate-binding protein
VWLDPANMIAMAEAVATQLRTITDSATIDANLGAYRSQLEQLDQRFTDGLRTCDSRLLVTGHRAFAYLAAAYGLEQVAVAGISPGEEPSAATLQQVADLAAAQHVTTIFFEENLPPALSQTVADEVGATTAVLDPIESLSADQIARGDDYVALMDANLAALRKGLGCA